VFISRELADSGKDSRMRDARTHEQNSIASDQQDDATMENRQAVAVYHRFIDDRVKHNSCFQPRTAMLLYASLFCNH
jgi:hypothetical protein